MSVQFGDTRLPGRFWSKCTPEPNSGCWLWCASSGTDGYGRFFVDAKVQQAHRIAYLALAGAIPSGLQLDHLCRMRCCVNPGHLEPVTPAENLRRGLGADATRAFHAAVTHCPRGHKYTAENTRRRRGRYRTRICKECNRQRCALWRERTSHLKDEGRIRRAW